MNSRSKNLAILVGGGPAPGINSVISAATIRSRLENVEIIGIIDGFKWLMKGNIDHVMPLTIKDVSRIHFRGGSFIGIARDNPTKNVKDLDTVVNSLLRLNVDKLITIGGDDTAYSAYKLEELSSGRIKVVHVPKTIDNDLDLPHGISTFGFQTARHIGVEIVKNLIVDATTTSRWYFVVAMGRKAGHLALGIGKAAGATLTLIPEEFPVKKLKLANITDILVGAIIKRLSYGKQNGVAILAEGLVELLDPEEIKTLAHIERDAHDNIRLAEVNFGEMMKYEIQNHLKKYNQKVTIIAKNIGYELRCADPIAYDMEYCRDLGYNAANFILNNGNSAMISIQNSQFVPMYFKDIIDPVTKKTKVRLVEPTSENYQVARQYMIRLTKDDFDDPHELARYAATAGISINEFKKQFEYLVRDNASSKNEKKTVTEECKIVNTQGNEIVEECKKTKQKK